MNPTIMTRRLHLIDIENLAGSPRPSSALTRSCAHRYRALTKEGAGDQTVIACNHGAALDVVQAWPARLLQRSGPDGADQALLDVLRYERVAERFTGVVVGSGDGIFAEAVARLGAAGVTVSVVSHRRSLSKRLALAASDVVYFDTKLPPAAAMRIRGAA